MTISDNDPRPPYLQLAEVLRREIREKKFKPGERLPSIRKLSAEYGIASQTVQNALRELRMEGLVVSQQGRAFFVRSNEGSPEGGETVSLIDRIAEIEAQMRDLRSRVAELEANAGAEETAHP